MNVAVSATKEYKVVFTVSRTMRAWVHVARRVNHELLFLGHTAKVVDAIPFDDLILGKRQAGGVKCRVEEAIVHFGKSEFDLIMNMINKSKFDLLL